MPLFCIVASLQIYCELSLLSVIEPTPLTYTTALDTP